MRQMIWRHWGIRLGDLNWKSTKMNLETGLSLLLVGSCCERSDSFLRSRLQGTYSEDMDYTHESVWSLHTITLLCSSSLTFQTSPSPSSPCLPPSEASSLPLPKRGSTTRPYSHQDWHAEGYQGHPIIMRYAEQTMTMDVSIYYIKFGEWRPYLWEALFVSLIPPFNHCYWEPTAGIRMM